MNNIFRKVTAFLLAMTFLGVPVFAEEDTKALYIAPFVSSEQISYTCSALIDDFEGNEDGWNVSDGEISSCDTTAACGAFSASVTCGEKVTVSYLFEALNLSSSDGVSAVFKSTSEKDVKISFSVLTGDNAYEAHGIIPPGTWYTVSIDIREMKKKDRVNGISITADGGFLLDFVHASSVYAPVGSVKNLTDEYTADGAEADVGDSVISLEFNGRNGAVESGHIDRLLNGGSALSITLDNRAGADEMTAMYSETFGTYRSKFTHVCDIAHGVGTYIVPLEGTDQIEGFKLEFSSKPNGKIDIFDVSIVPYAVRDSKGECHFDGESIVISYENKKIPDGCPVYLYRSLFAEEEGMPYLANLNGEKEFSFPVVDGGKNNLLYKYDVMYENDGELTEVYRNITVSNPEECAKAGTSVQSTSKKGVYGEFYRGAGTVFLEIDPYAFISDSETKYSYAVGGKTFYIHTDSAEYLDKRVTGISNTDACVYIVLSLPISPSEMQNEEFVCKYSATAGYIASRYNGGDDGTVNGFVIGEGLFADSTSQLEFLRCVFDTVYFSSVSENSKSAVVLSLDGDKGIPPYGFASVMTEMCPYISDVMVFTDDVEKCLDNSLGFDMHMLVSALEGMTGKEIGLLVYAGGYSEPYGELVRDFYSLYENTSLKCLAVKYDSAVKSGKVFEYMDTADAEKYIGGLCGNFGLESWDELCDTSLFSENVRENAVGYLSYGTDMTGRDKIFDSKAGGKWLKGVGCASVSADEKYIMASLDSRQTGCGYVVFIPDNATMVQKRTVSVKLKVDYLKEVESAEVFLCAVYGKRTAYCAVDIKADTDTVISFDIGSIRRAEKLIIGINGEGTPRLCISEGFVSHEKGEEDDGSEIPNVFQTDGGKDITEKKTDNVTLLLTAVFSILAMFAASGFVMYFLNKKKS